MRVDGVRENMWEVEKLFSSVHTWSFTTRVGVLIKSWMGLIIGLDHVVTFPEVSEGLASGIDWPY